MAWPRLNYSDDAGLFFMIGAYVTSIIGSAIIVIWSFYQFPNDFFGSGDEFLFSASWAITPLIRYLALIWLSLNAGILSRAVIKSRRIRRVKDGVA